jgi:hypothetical protein
MCFSGAVEGNFLFNLQACFGLQWDICSRVMLVTVMAAKYDRLLKSGILLVVQQRFTYKEVL